MIFNRRDTEKAKSADTYGVKSCNASQVAGNQIGEIKQKDIDGVMVMNQEKG